MPKITRWGGASSAPVVPEQAAGGVVQHAPLVGEDGPPPAFLPEREHPGTGVPMEGIEVPADGAWSPELVGDGTGEPLPLADESQGEEEPSPGSSSETSPEKPPTSPQTSETAPRKPARTTGSRSKRARGASSTAGSTDGSGGADAT
ncbi:hypothetical protein ABZW11_17155 [Nonomuraea sp. NPDC004580]|uniref:hypothetical protein n=1 Tax=Nonomuraea sp. NPDC004580 TaxID=3154552 RepID=UPI0033B75D3F